MKQLLLTIVALCGVIGASATEYLYMDDINVNPNSLGSRITVPVKAHFDYYLNAFQLDIECPDGLTPVAAGRGADMGVTYNNANGDIEYYDPIFRYNDEVTRFIGAINKGGYWLVNGQWQMYGAVKWDPGDYDEMMTITFEVAPDFNSGTLVMTTQPSSGYDDRGEVCPQGQKNTWEVGVTVDVYAPEPDPVTGNFFSMENVEVFSGDTFVLTVSMTNEATVSAFQTDIYLPEGFEIVNVDGEYAIEWCGRVTSDHIILANALPDGGVRMLSYSPSLRTFAGHEGELFKITVKAPEGCEGVYPVSLSNTRWTVTGDQEMTIPTATCEVSAYNCIMGDVDQSGSITVTDVVITARYILNYNPIPFNIAAADMNGDCEITVTDLMMIARLVMGAKLNAPRQQFGLQLTNDRMGGDDISIGVGETRTVSIELTNEDEYSAFEFEMQLPEGLTASNFALTDRAGSHAIDAVFIGNGKMRVLCYSPALSAIEGKSGALLTFDVTAGAAVTGEIVVDRIEMVGAGEQMVHLDVFALKVNNVNTAAGEIKAATRIYAMGNDIIVECPVDMTVTVTDVAGRTQRIDARAGRNVIPSRQSGVVIVSADGSTAKLLMR